MPPGFYYYLFLIDGAPVYDRDSRAYFGWGTWVGGFDVKDSANTFYDQQAGPFGNMNTNWYKSAITGGERKCYVYTPAEYDSHPERNYPVLYLLHDSAEDESAWLYQGDCNNILDNAINAGIADNMLVVLANISAFKHIDGQATGPNLIDSLITSELVPYVDSNYHTLDSSAYRAIAGCSEGGKYAMETALAHHDMFGSLGIFSLPTAIDTSQAVADSINSAQFKLLWLGAGDSDSTYSIAEAFHTKISGKGIDDNWDVEKGSFNWLVWRKNFYGMIQKLFK